MLIFAWAFTPGAFAAAAKKQDKIIQDIAGKMDAATVRIVTHHDNRVSGGTGFIVGDGYIVTSAHVINKHGKNMDFYVLNERIQIQKASVVKKLHSGYVDLAVLRFDPPEGVELPILPLNLNAKEGDRVSAWGYPETMVTEVIDNYGKHQAIPAFHAEGKILKIVQVRGRPGSSLILISVPVEDGYSGSALVNEKGEIVGMNTWSTNRIEDKKFLWGEAQAAVNIAYFLIDCGITPNLVAGQSMPAKK